MTYLVLYILAQSVHVVGPLLRDNFGLSAAVRLSSLGIDVQLHGLGSSASQLGRVAVVRRL